MEQETVKEETLNQNTDTQVGTDINQPKKNFQTLKIFTGVLVIIAVVIGTMYYISIQPSKPVEDISIPAANPDTVRAVVNGEDIIQSVINDRLAEAGQTLLAQGVNINDPSVRSQIETQILEDTISYTLLKQEAANAGVKVDPASIEELFQTFVIQAGGEDQLLSQLQQVGLTEDSFRGRLAEQLVIEAYLDENTIIGDIVVTDEDITNAYNTAVANAGEGALPSLSDVRDQIEQQISDQKRQEIIATFTNTLRNDAIIERK